MTDLSIFREWDDRKIRIRPSDRYVCLTDMAKANERRSNVWRRFKTWRQLDSTQEFLETLSRETRIPRSQLIRIVSIGSNKLRGTWAHPRAAVRFAQWCTDRFALQVDFWLSEVSNISSLGPSPRGEGEEFKKAAMLSKDIILSQFDSDEPFPIDFDDAWQWLGFGAKYDAKVSLKSAGFSESIDFRSFQESSGKLQGGRPTEKIHLTIDCFKTWAMMARTPQGKKVRQWYLQIEKEWRQMKLAPAPIDFPHIVDMPRPLPPTRDAIEYQAAIEQLPNVEKNILRAALESPKIEACGAQSLWAKPTGETDDRSLYQPQNRLCI